MAQHVTLENFAPSNIKEKSALNADATDGTQSLVLLNSDDIAADDPIVIGQLGSETTEISTINTVGEDNNLTLTDALTKSHRNLEPVTILRGAYLKVYRAANVDNHEPADADYAVVGSPVAIEPDQLSTIVNDPTGSEDYWYKYTYSNADGTVETSLADCVAVRGGLVNQYATDDEIKGEAGMRNNTYLSGHTIAVARKQAQSIIDGSLSGLYAVPFTQPINPLIQRITMLFAAGYILKNDYGVLTAGASKDGKAKVDEAQSLLDRIRSGSMVLLDATGITTEVTTSSGPNGWPDDSTGVADDTKARKFVIGERF